MELDIHIERLNYLNQKLTKIIHRGKDLSSAKVSSVLEECRSLRSKLEQAASNFVDTNDFSNFDKVIETLHATGALLIQIDENLTKKSSIDIKSDPSDDDENLFSCIQFSTKTNQQSLSDASDLSDAEFHIKHKHEKRGKHEKKGKISGRRSAKTASSDSSFMGTVEGSDSCVFEDPCSTFQADFSGFMPNQPTKTPSFTETAHPQQALDPFVEINSLKNTLRDAMQVIDGYKTYSFTLEQLLRDFILGNLHLNPNDRAKFLDLNNDNAGFIDNLSSSLGLAIKKPQIFEFGAQQSIQFQADFNKFTATNTNFSKIAPVFHLRRMGLTSKMPFIEPISFSNYFGHHLYKPMPELLRFGNLFAISLSGDYLDFQYSIAISLKCLTQSMDIFMSFPSSSAIIGSTVSKHMSKNSVAEIKGLLNLTHGPFPSLCLSIVQSDGFTCKFAILLPLGPFLTLSSSFITTREFETLWASPIYTNSQFSSSETSMFSYESTGTLPMASVLFEDIKSTLTLNGIINVTALSEKPQTIILQLSSTFAHNFFEIFRIDPHFFRDCSKMCLLGKVTAKSFKTRLNIKLELKSIVPVLLVSTRECIKEALYAMLSERSPPSDSPQKFAMDKDITLPLPFENSVNEELDFS